MLGKRNEGTRERWNRGRVDSSLVPSFPRSLVQAFTSLLRQLAGMPDYAAYLEHLHRCHPERPVPTEREFYADFVRWRYGDGASRCC